MTGELKPGTKAYEAIERTLAHYLRSHGRDIARVRIVLVNSYTQAVPNQPAREEIEYEFQEISYGRAENRRGVISLEEVRDYYRKNKQEIETKDFRPQFETTPPASNRPIPAIRQAQQMSWESERIRLDWLYELRGPNAVSTQSPDTPTRTVRKFLPEANVIPGVRIIKMTSAKDVSAASLVCTCLEETRKSTFIMCEHLRWSYLHRRDAGMFFEDDYPILAAVPIGMGQHWTLVTASEVHGQPDTRVLASSLHRKICDQLGYPYDPFQVGRDEGVMSFVRFLEELVEETGDFREQIKPTNIYSTACTRSHGQPTAALAVERLRPNNTTRHLWVQANVAHQIELGEQASCLACVQMGIGDNDVPEF